MKRVENFNAVQSGNLLQLIAHEGFEQGADAQLQVDREWVIADLRKRASILRKQAAEWGAAPLHGRVLRQKAADIEIIANEYEKEVTDDKAD